MPPRVTRQSELGEMRKRTMQYRQDKYIAEKMVEELNKRIVELQQNRDEWRAWCMCALEECERGNLATEKLVGPIPAIRLLWERQCSI